MEIFSSNCSRLNQTLNQLSNLFSDGRSTGFRARLAFGLGALALACNCCRSQWFSFRRCSSRTSSNRKHGASS